MKLDEKAIRWIREKRTSTKEIAEIEGISERRVNKSTSSTRMQENIQIKEAWEDPKRSLKRK